MNTSFTPYYILATGYGSSTVQFSHVPNKHKVDPHIHEITRKGFPILCLLFINLLNSSSR